MRKVLTKEQQVGEARKDEWKTSSPYDIVSSSKRIARIFGRRLCDKRYLYKEN